MTYEYPAEIAALRERVAFHKQMAEFYRRRGERFLKERDEALGRVDTLEGELKTMTGNRDRGMQVNQEALAAWAKDRERFATLEVRIRDKADWWDRHEPLAAGFRVSDDFRSLLDEEDDR